MRKYRIIVETEARGKKWFYVQKRFLRYFWLYETECRDITMREYRIAFQTLELAEDYIALEISNKNEKKSKRIVKRDIIWLP